jgi:hypothetical protein
MLRYYMTPETRQAVIAESNRLIATRAAMYASRRHLDTYADGEPSEHGALPSHADNGTSATQGAFARLVADLQSVAASSAR